MSAYDARSRYPGKVCGIEGIADDPLFTESLKRRAYAHSSFITMSKFGAYATAKLKPTPARHSRYFEMGFGFID